MHSLTPYVWTIGLLQRDNTAPVFLRCTEAVNGETQEMPTTGKCLGSTIQHSFSNT